MSLLSRLFGRAPRELDRRVDFEKAAACWKPQTVDIAFMVLSSGSAARSNYEQLKAEASSNRSNLFVVRGFIANSARRTKNPWTLQGFYEAAGRSGHFVGVVSPNRVGEGDARWFARISDTFQGRTADLISIRDISVAVFGFDSDAYRRAFTHDLSIFEYQSIGKLRRPHV
jgi:hypothetical protein